MSLGMNTHLKQKVNDSMKKVSVEKLYSSIKAHEKNNDITIECDDTLRSKLKLFGLKKSINYNSHLLTKDQFSAIKNFSKRTDITVRSADKSNVFVVMNTADYNRKLGDILSDQGKFKVIYTDPTNNLKKELNKHITVANAVSDGNKLTKLIGHYEPCYAYANPKIHKRIINPPVRPIVSQIGTPTAQVASELNEVITKYMPTKYMVKSTSEFMDLIRKTTFPESSILASLDVDSLFTNVPVYETINIILDYVYHHPTLLPSTIPESTLKQLLTLCTTKTPFRSTDGKL